MNILPMILADGSDDEKGIEKAERKAGKRATDTAPGKPRGQFRYTAQALPTLAAAAPVMTVAYHQPKRQFTAPAVSRPLGPCFSCGEMGHLRHYCLKAPAENRKWYPFVKGCV